MMFGYLFFSAEDGCIKVLIASFFLSGSIFPKKFRCKTISSSNSLILLINSVVPDANENIEAINTDKPMPSIAFIVIAKTLLLVAIGYDISRIMEINNNATPNHT